MPGSIPYNPSLVLGNIVDPGALDTLLQISACQAAIDAAHDKLKSFMSMKRSIDMTIQELTNMDINTTDLIKKSEEIGKSIVSAAVEYAGVRVEQETKVQELKGKVQTVNRALESPVDFDKTGVKEMALAADSLTMDVQYFSFNENEKNTENTIATIKDFIDASTDVLGDAMSGKISSAATSQINKQKENHDIAGTLIITASCTHRSATMLSPLVLDIDKAVSVWNELFRDDADKIKVHDPAAVQQAAAEETNQEKSISLLSGATYGSSFVGMVHVLRKESAKALPPELVENIQEQFTVGKWFARESGGFGIDPSFSGEIKNLLSSQNITAHITIITMGVVPSLKSNELRIGVKTFAEVDTTKTVEEVSAVTSGAGERKTLSSSAASAQAGAEMLAVKASSVQNVMMGLSKIDESANRVLDINSMMTAFEDYISKINQGKTGVPVNYYLKNITRGQLAQLWLARYYPSGSVTNTAVNNASA